MKSVLLSCFPAGIKIFAILEVNYIYTFNCWDGKIVPELLCMLGILCVCFSSGFGLFF